MLRASVELGQEAAPSGANDSSPGWFDSVRVDERSAWIEESAHPCLVEARSAEGHEYMDGKKISDSSPNVHTGQCWRWDAALFRPPWAPTEFDGFRQTGGRPA